VRFVHPYNAVAMDDAIKKAAAERAAKMGLTYAGALLPAEAHALMEQGAKLVDVRTKPEVLYVGKVPGSLALEWQTYPGNRPNPEFLGELAAAVGKEEPVMFMCRSGARSHAVAEAATRAGWRECYNILEGFEGDKDGNGHRSSVGGWRKAGLPWTQG
jgi:rhodanese-related sulfurtransferase